MSSLNNDKRTIVLPIVLFSSITLAVLSYNYFTQTATQIQDLAINDLQTNAKIEAYSMSNSLSNAISAVTSNLVLIANSPSTIEGNISDIQKLLDIGINSTQNLTDGYYYVDHNGRLMTFTGIQIEDNLKYGDIDMSQGDYFQIPKQSKAPYISTVIDPDYTAPRIYLSFPILDGNQTKILEIIQSEKDELDTGQVDSNSIAFNGLIVASIALGKLGDFLEGQIHPDFNGDITFIDRNNSIIYTQNQTYIGKDYFGNEFQSLMKSDLQNKYREFNNIINKALHLDSGLDEFNFENTSATIAYDAVKGPAINGERIFNNRIGTLFITTPHTLATDVASLIDNQKITNFWIIVSIAGIATVIAVMLLRWNKTLQDAVNEKTSQLRETIQKLTKANEELKSHDKMQKEFINIAAHGLRTPSQAISGNLELIEVAYLPSLLSSTSIKEDHNSFDEELDNLTKCMDQRQGFRSCLVSTYRNSVRLQKLVNNILDVSRIESNKLELHKEHFNLNEIIKNVIKDIHIKKSTKLSIVSLQKNIHIIFEPSEDPLTVYADKVRIFEVLGNIITNAIKFSNEKPITISTRKKDIIGSFKIQNNNIKGSNKTHGKENDVDDRFMAVVSIKDRGSGINPEILPMLFTKFTTTSDQGTGLELYIAKSIVEAHGGLIWGKNYRNDEEKGATFYFSLPLNI